MFSRSTVNTCKTLGQCCKCLCLALICCYVLAAASDKWPCVPLGPIERFRYLQTDWQNMMESCIIHVASEGRELYMPRTAQCSLLCLEATTMRNRPWRRKKLLSKKHYILSLMTRNILFWSSVCSEALRVPLQVPVFNSRTSQIILIIAMSLVSCWLWYNTSEVFWAPFGCQAFWGLAVVFLQKTCPESLSHTLNWEQKIKFNSSWHDHLHEDKAQTRNAELQIETSWPCETY